MNKSKLFRLVVITLGAGATLATAVPVLRVLAKDDAPLSIKSNGDKDLRLGVPNAQPSAGTPSEAARSGQLSSEALKRPRRDLKVIEPERSEGLSTEEIWLKHFAANREETGDVRETCRVLKKDEKYDDVVGMIRAALLHGQAQPWMYEAMGIALIASGAPRDEIERTLMSAVDLFEEPEYLMLAADYMSRLGFEDRALKIFRDVSASNPTQPEPYLQGLAAAQRIDDREGIQWACVGILSLAWGKEHRDVELKAYRIAVSTLEELKKSGKTSEYQEFEKQLLAAMARDAIVKVTWTGDADIDIQVQEPSGEVCSLHRPRTNGGGVLIGDEYSNNGEKSAEGVSEYYVCPRGFDGEYKVLLRRVWGKVTAGKLTVDVFTNYGTKEQVHIQRQIPLRENAAMVVFELENGRRTELLQDHQIAQVARGQQALGRAVLAQQLGAYETSDATTDYLRDALQASRDGRLPRRRRGVGTRPVITTLPEGTNFSASAVISADRRYVRTTPSPLFSGIGNVDTFTFNSQGGGNQGGGGGGGVIGGGGGVLGGGPGGQVLGGGRR